MNSPQFRILLLIVILIALVLIFLKTIRSTYGESIKSDLEEQANRRGQKREALEEAENGADVDEEIEVEERAVCQVGGREGGRRLREVQR